MTPSGALPENNQERARETSEVLRRVTSALVLIAVALGAVIASPWTFLGLVLVAAVILAWEWGRLTRGNGFDGTALIQAVSVGAVAILVSLGRPDLALFVLVAACAAVGLAGSPKVSAAWSVAGLAYAALPAWALTWLRSDQELGAAAVLYVFAVAWTTDTASYFAGRYLGGPKLAPRVSPQKTWSGFAGGLLVPALIGYVFAVAVGDTTVWRLALLSIALALTSQMGDLIESAVKRHFGAKDMSQLIPGHGGLFDRIDSLLFASVIAGLIALRNPGHPGDGLLIW